MHFNDLELHYVLAKMYIAFKLKSPKKDIFLGPMSGTYEGGMIAPSYELIKMLYHYLFIPLIPALNDLENNVSFLTADLGDHLELFKMSCDWCSICNGIVHTAMENLAKRPDLHKYIDFTKLITVSHFLDDALKYRRTKISGVYLVCLAKFGRVTRGLFLITRMYLQLEQIELRWCPFKRSKSFYYRNRDSRYVGLSLQNIYKIGEILAHEETISCEQCPTVINQFLLQKNEPSIFQPLLTLMLNLIATYHKNVEVLL